MIKIFRTESNFCQNITKEIIEYSEICIANRGYFHFLICGGTSPITLYKFLSIQTIDWSCWHFWISDERYIPNNSIHLNSTIIKENLLKNIPVNNNNIHFFDINLNVQDSIKKYELMLLEIKYFDLCLLGVGEDGHVASLFPGMNLEISENSPNILFINNSPKYPKNRLTLSGKMINKSRQIFYIAKGAEKKYIVDKFQNEKSLPFNNLNGIEKTTLYFLK